MYGTKGPPEKKSRLDVFGGVGNNLKFQKQESWESTGMSCWYWMEMDSFNYIKVVYIP